MPLLCDPVGRDEARFLRSVVLSLARRDHRVRLPTTVHVGGSGAWSTGIEDDPSWDVGLRTEMVGAALRAWADPPWVWVARSGPLIVQDADAAWLAATMTASGERETDVAFVVVTRHGWLDPRSGATRVWKRIRQR